MAVGRSVWWRAVRTSPSLASGLVLSLLLPPSAQFYSSCNLAFKIVSFSNSNRAVSLFILRRGGFCAVDTPVVARSPPSPSSHLSPLAFLPLQCPFLSLCFLFVSFLFLFFSCHSLSLARCAADPLAQHDFCAAERAKEAEWLKRTPSRRSRRPNSSR